MSGRWSVIGATTLALMLSGCGAFDDVGTLWGEESTAEKEARQQVVVARQNKVPMQSVRNIEIGRTRNGVLVTAFGTAPGLGYSLPALRVRRDGRPAADGFLEFDFVASPPVSGLDLPPGTTRTRGIRADLALTTRQLRRIAGVRVYALGNASQVSFGATN